MKPPLDWIEGSEEIRDRVEGWWQGPLATSPHARQIAHSKRRSVIHLSPPGGSDLIIKCFREKRGPGAPLSLIKRTLGRAPWQREWQALKKLAASKPIAPASLGLARTPENEVLLIGEFIDGPSLWEALTTPDRDSTSALALCGQAVGRLHQAGLAHGDLHPGNLLLADTGPVLIDFQRCTRLRPRSRVDDLARLDFSLALIDIPENERSRLIRDALPTGFDLNQQRERILKRARYLASQHRRIRMRHCLRPSPERAALRSGDRQGMRRMDFSEDELRAVLQSYGQERREAGTRSDEEENMTPVRACERRFRIYEQRPRSKMSRIRQSILGSEGRRAWQNAHDPLLRNEGSRMVAFCEQRSLGLLASSLWIVEDEFSD